jgi:hypothetical protein
MAKLYDVAVKTGSYTDKSGATKGRYENIGVMMEGDNGGVQDEGAYYSPLPPA